MCAAKVSSGLLPSQDLRSRRCLLPLYRQCPRCACPVEVCTRLPRSSSKCMHYLPSLQEMWVKLGAVVMTQWLKRLLCTCENLCLDPQAPVKADSAAHDFNPRVSTRWKVKAGECLQVHCQLVWCMQHQMRRASISNKVEGKNRQTPGGCPLISTSLYILCSLQAHTLIHLNTHMRCLFV